MMGVVAWRLGVAWVLGELPNSFLKRRIGIVSGQQSGPWQWLADHLDSCSAVALYLCVFEGWPVTEVAPVLPCAALIHGAHNLVCHHLRNPPSPTAD